jgi:hypothetical protein
MPRSKARAAKNPAQLRRRETAVVAPANKPIRVNNPAEIAIIKGIRLSMKK